MGPNVVFVLDPIDFQCMDENSSSEYLLFFPQKKGSLTHLDRHEGE